MKDYYYPTFLKLLRSCFPLIFFLDTILFEAPAFHNLFQSYITQDTQGFLALF